MQERPKRSNIKLSSSGFSARAAPGAPRTPRGRSLRAPANPLTSSLTEIADPPIRRAPGRPPARCASARGAALAGPRPNIVLAPRRVSHAGVEVEDIEGA